MRKIAFVINPKAGQKKGINIQQFIQDNCPKELSIQIFIWEPIQSFESIKQTYLSENYDVVVACGGDGTVNAVAESLLNQSPALGILPLGSGNGLARSLGYPMDLKKALDFICKEKMVRIDSNQVNQQNSFCVAGVGFDAHVSALFAHSKTRGLISYIGLSVKAYFGYKKRLYTIVVDEQKIYRMAFLISICNSPQYGNNAYIAPQAEVNDGITEVAIIKKLPLWYAPMAAYRLFSKTIHRSSYIEIIKGKHIEISTDTMPISFHTDGEPHHAHEKVVIQNRPLSLKVVSSL
jgi:diacylglycerol kinase (ATP)